MRGARHRRVRLILAALAALVSGATACSTASHDSADAGPPSRDATSDARDGKGDADGGPAALALTALRVTTKVPASPPVELIPPFSPGVHDYSVRCAAGTNDLVVSMTASSGAESLLVQPIESPSLPEQTVSLKVKEDAAIVAEAKLGEAREAYWVRCLPSDFPPIGWTPHPENGTPSPGYYLLGNATAFSDQNGYAMILDGNGVPVWYYRSPGRGVFNVDDVVKGAVSFIGAPVVSSYEVHHLSPPATDFITATGLVEDEHELRVLPGGDYLAFLRREVPADLSGLAVPLPDGGTETLGPNDYVFDCDIAEVDGKGDVVWQWYGTDHFDPIKDVTYIVFAPAPGGGVLLDAFHCNSIDVDPSGNLLVSARSMDSVFYVERPSGRVLWKMGGKPYTTDDATYIPVGDPFYRQHDARFQTSWTSACSGGQISVFDDETGKPGPARAAIYDVHVGALAGDAGVLCAGDGGTSGAKLTWEYRAKTPVEIMGSFRISPDGSRVVGWGINSGLVFSEVNAKGQDLLDVDFGNGEPSYRVIKVLPSAFDLDVLRNTSGQ
jgi:hypothetical protein